MQLAGLTEALREAPLAGTCLKTGLAMHYAPIVVEKTRKKWGLKCTATSALITLGGSLLYLIKECPTCITDIQKEISYGRSGFR